RGPALSIGRSTNSGSTRSSLLSSIVASGQALYIAPRMYAALQRRSGRKPTEERAGYEPIGVNTLLGRHPIAKRARTSPWTCLGLIDHPRLRRTAAVPLTETLECRWQRSVSTSAVRTTGALLVFMPDSLPAICRTRGCSRLLGGLSGSPD